MKIWFTSDHHFGHTNIIKYSNRPFNDLEEMHEVLIGNHNDLVSSKDKVYHLGDFTFRGSQYAKELMEQMNGKFILIKGNHDYWTKHLKDIKISNLEDICDYKEIKFHKRRIVLFHYPIENWKNSHHDSIHFHGHSHGKSRFAPRRRDVGVDANNYKPVELTEELMDILKKDNHEYRSTN